MQSGDCALQEQLLKLRQRLLPFWQEVRKDRGPQLQLRMGQEGLLNIRGVGLLHYQHL